MNWTNVSCLAVTLGAAALVGCQQNGDGHGAAGAKGMKDDCAECCAADANAAAAENASLVTMRGKPVTVVGKQPKVGDAAPAFTAVANDMAPYAFDPKAGKVTIISAVPSVDTGTCSTQTKRFNQEAEKLGADVSVVTVSMDLPFAQKRWCGAEGVKSVQVVSDAKDRAFADAYGLRIKESGLLARSVFVVGKDGKIAYAQVVPELSQEPNYDPVLAAARAAAGK